MKQLQGRRSNFPFRKPPVSQSMSPFLVCVTSGEYENEMFTTRLNPRVVLELVVISYRVLFARLLFIFRLQINMVDVLKF
jgi:hypothetical protein